MNNLLLAENLRIRLQLGTQSPMNILDGISFNLQEGEILAIVGEPGCGKSTLANACVGTLTSPFSVVSGNLKSLRLGKQAALLQAPLTQSLDENQTVFDFAQPLLAFHFPSESTSQLRKRLLEALNVLDGHASALDSLANSLSPLEYIQSTLSIVHAISPKVIVADNLLSALSEDLHQQVIALFHKMLSGNNTPAILWLCGNLKELDHFAHRICVLFAGEFVEDGTADQILHTPKHPYTRMLHARSQPATYTFQSPNMRNPPIGCRFAFRCPIAGPECANAKQLVRTVAERDVKCMYAQ